MIEATELKKNVIAVTFNVIASIQNVIQIHQSVQKLFGGFLVPTSKV